MASAVEQALAKQFAGNGPMFMPSTSVNDLYAGMLPAAQPRTNPLAPSQGGPWPASQPQRPRSTPLSPQNYTPNIPPQIPNDPRRATADMRVPGMVGPGQGTMQPFPLAYPDNAPIDITVRGGNVASVPLPQRRPWDAPTEMDLAAIAGQEAGMQPPVASAYAPQPAENPAVAAAMAGLSPLSASERINQPMPGAPAAPPRVAPGQAYADANTAAADRARTQDRSGVGSDGYVRDAAGNVTGRDPQYSGLSPSQMYDQLSGRPTGARIDGNPDNHTFSGDTRHKWNFGEGRPKGNAVATGQQPVTLGPVQAPRSTPAPVTLGPMQRPAQSRFGGSQPPARTGGQMLPPLQTNGLSGRKMRF